MDLFAFSKGDPFEIERKAIELEKRFDAWGKPMEGGHMFFLRASREALKERLARRGTIKVGSGKYRFDAKALIQQETELLKIYNLNRSDTTDTTDSTAGETARAIAKTILLGDYKPFDFLARLQQIIQMGGAL